MRLFLFSATLLLLCSCSGGKPQYIPPPKPVEPEPVVQLETTEPRPVVQAKAVEPVVANSFLAILQQEGVPSENIVPRSKEQVAVYRRGESFRFYYFKQNLLVSQKDYPATAVQQFKTTNSYPAVILKELGASD